MPGSRRPFGPVLIALVFLHACSCGKEDPPFTCEGIVCPENGFCSVTATGPQCFCDAGFEREGRVCHDVDECAAPERNACDARATCTNLPGDYACTCPEEHVGDGFTCTPFGPWMWATRAPGASFSSGLDLAVDGDGNTVVVGVLSGDVQFGPDLIEAPFDAGFIAKLSPEGEWLWARQVGQEPSAMVTSVAVDAQGAVYVTGWFWGTATFGGQTLEALDADDAFIARLSADGAWEWARQIEGNGARGTALVVDPDGAPVVMGGFWGEAILGDETLTAEGFGDVFLARLTPQGDFTWVEQLASSEVVNGAALAVGEDGELVVAGDFSGMLSVGPHTRVAGGFSDAFVAKLDAAGAWSWVAQAGSTSTVMVGGIALAPDRTPIVIGTFHDTASFGPLEQTGLGEAEIYVAALTPEGEWSWVTRAGGTKGDLGLGIAVSGDTVSVVGEFARAANFGGTRLESRGLQDVFIGQLDREGSWLWAARAGGTSADTGAAIAAGPDEGLHVTGSFAERGLFMPFELSASGALELFVGRAEPSVLP